MPLAVVPPGSRALGVDETSDLFGRFCPLTGRRFVLVACVPFSPLAGPVAVPSCRCRLRPFVWLHPPRRVPVARTAAGGVEKVLRKKKGVEVQGGFVDSM